MWIQQQTKVKVFGAAAIVALMLVCSIAAFASLTSSSSSVQFPNQAVGTASAPKSVTITNTNNNSVTIIGVTSSRAQFSYSGPALPLTLAGGQSFTAAVTFAPTQAQLYSGTLTLTRNNGPRLNVSLSGAGVSSTAGSLTTSMSAISFNAQAGGVAPAAQSMTIGSSPSSATAFTVSADQAWIALSATSGTTSSAIQVGANNSGLAAGNYSGHVIISAAGVTNAPVSIPVTLAVAAAAPTAALTAAPSAISFSAQVGAAAPGAQALTIGENPAGIAPFTVSADQAWLTLSAASGSTSSAISVGANISGLAAGTYNGHVLVAAAGVTNSPLSVPVTLVVAAAAQTHALTAAPGAMAFTAQAGGAAPAAQALTVGENPAGALPFTVSADQAWLTLSAASGTTSSAIQVGANISGLAAGNYTGHVIISAAGVTNSPMSVTVTLAVTAASSSPYVMVPTPSSVAFSGTVGSTPVCQSVTVDDTTPNGPLPVAIRTDAAWLTVTPTVGFTKLIASVCVKTTGLAAGSFTGHVLVTATGPNSSGFTVNNSPLSIPVTLVIGSTSGSTLTASPTSVAFGNINLGNNNTKSVTVTNSGTSSATISQVNVVGAGISASGITVPMVLSAGQTTVLSIVFAPTAAGVVNGTVSVVSDATNSPAVVAATGTGVQASLTASPTTLNFGNVTVGSSGSQTITLSNNGSAAASISQAAVSGTGYTISGITLPMSLAVGASSSFAVQFAPTVAGTVSGGVTVTSNTPNSPTLVGLSGTGAAVVSHSVSLAWVASTSTVVGYNIYRGSVSGGSYSLLNSAPNSSMSFTDSAVVSGQTYFYVVTAVDASGTESVVSNEVSAIIP